MHRTLRKIATLSAITDNTTIFGAIYTVCIVTAADVAAVPVYHTDVGVVCTSP